MEDVRLRSRVAQGLAGGFGWYMVTAFAAYLPLMAIKYRFVDPGDAYRLIWYSSAVWAALTGYLFSAFSVFDESGCFALRAHLDGVSYVIGSAMSLPVCVHMLMPVLLLVETPLTREDAILFVLGLLALETGAFMWTMRATRVQDRVRSKSFGLFANRKVD